MSACVTLLVLDAARPWAALALLAPALFLALLRLLARPPEVVVGTLALWKELPQPTTRGRGARGRVPAWAWVLAAGLALGALAALGPRASAPPPARTWTVVVDRSPSMELAVGAEDTRQAAALARAEEWLAAATRRGDRVRWLAPGRSPLELARGERPPAAWLAPEAGGAADEGAPEWARHDEPGTLWVTDVAPQDARAHAGLFASGGPAAAGPIAVENGAEVVWTAGGELVERPLAAPLAVLVREPAGLALPPVLERVLAAWAGARGLEIVRVPRAGTVLVLELEQGVGDAVPVELARDGWSASGRAARFAPEDETGEAWLVARVDGAPRTVIAATGGRVRTVLHAVAEPAGDPARFALSFARLFDAHARSGPGVVPLAERRAAGEARVAPGEPPPAESGADPGPYVDAALALGAALCALAAFLLRG